MEVNKINTTCSKNSEVNNLQTITLRCPAHAVTNAIFRFCHWLKFIPGIQNLHVTPLQKIQKLDYGNE